MALKSTVQIEVASRDGKSFLKKSFCHSPFKIADITEDKRRKELRLMLMSSSPGVLDGDEMNFEIAVAADSSLVFETQSYQRIFQMKKGATQKMTVTLGEGSAFTYLPHPVVPHAASIYSSHNKIYLTDNCTLVWGEVISCGRKLNNEVFRFSSFHSITEIFLNKKLVLKENLQLKPAENNPAQMGQLEGYTHQATFLYLNQASSTDELISILIEFLQPQDGLTIGISALPVNGFVVRLLGHKAEQLFHLLRSISEKIESLKHITPQKAVAYV